MSTAAAPATTGRTAKFVVLGDLADFPPFQRLRADLCPLAAYLWQCGGRWLAADRAQNPGAREPQVPRRFVVEWAHNVPDADLLAGALVDAGLWWERPGWVVGPVRGYAMAYQDEYWRIVFPRRPKIPADVRAAVYARDGHRCVLCGTGDDLSLDHLVPWARGGSDAPANLQTMCRPCNSRKGARV